MSEYSSLKEMLKDAGAAIQEKDGSTDTFPAKDIPDRIRAINSISSSDGWQPHPDWWDIQYCVDNNVDFNGNPIEEKVFIGFIVTDSHDTITFPLPWKLLKGTIPSDPWELPDIVEYTIYLSDGSVYRAYVDSEITHTWDKTKDKECSLGYKTRAVLITVSTGFNIHVSISQRSYALDSIDSLYIYIGDCNVSSIKCGDNNSRNSNALLQAVKCSKLTTANADAIGMNAFYNCLSLVSITIPEGVTSIGEYAFDGCYLLQSITIPEGVTSIGNYAFSDCYSLQSITIPEGVTSIGNYAFSDCYSLQSITIPDSVTSIGDYTFVACSLLQSITIPQSVTSMGDYAFRGCDSLKSITISQGVTSIGFAAFMQCSSLQNVVLPSSLTSIGEGAFMECFSLKSLILPEGIKSIGESAFTTCVSLQSITIPQSITSMGDYVFSRCLSLINVYVNPGFSSDLDISTSVNLSVSSLEKIIENYADMTGITAPTLKIGDANLSKLSQDYIDLAASKNITLA